jgi:branched-chain amino acid transport system substrate-binding protein
MGLDEVGTARTLREHRKVAEKGKWDLLEQVGVLSGPEAFRPLEEGGCALVQESKSD